MDLASVKATWQDSKELPNRAYMVARRFQDQLLSLYPAVENPVARLWLYLNDLESSAVICERSGRNRRFLNLESGVLKFCGNQGSCVCNRENSQMIIKSRDAERKQQIQQRRNATCEQRYGVAIASQSKAVKAKAAATCLQRYGTISPTQNPGVLLKSKHTCMQSLGVEYPMQDPEVLSRARQTFLERYGVERPSQFEDFKQRHRETMLERYGVAHHMQHEEIAQRIRERGRYTKYQSLIDRRSDFTPLFTAKEYARADANAEFQWRCNACNTEFAQPIIAGGIRCPVCNPANETWGETAIREYLQQHALEFQQFDRSVITPKELDFYIPKHNLAIEFNGLYWHSEKILGDQCYHFQKFQDCASKGVKLIQIFEHELKFKPDIVFDGLDHVLQVNRKCVEAGSCQLVRLDSQTAKDFFNSNHLQGDCSTAAVWGLEYNDTIVAALSMARSHHSENLAHWELLRYATHKGYTLVNGLTMLFSAAVQELQPGSVVSNVNLNWGLDQAYSQAGFEFVGYSDPTAWYFKSLDQVHTSDNCFKLAESPCSAANGWQRFWDSGNAVWLWQR